MRHADRLWAVLVLIAAIAMAFLLVKGRKGPVKRVVKHHFPLVEIAIAKKAGTEIPLKVTGTVQAKRETRLIPQVSGLITWVNPRFFRGVFFRKGEVLFRIDDTDYVNALEEAKARLTKARLDLEKTRAQARIARQEWKLQEHESGERPLPLVFYEPQYENARQMVRAAESSVKKAMVDLERTIIKAPFDCYVKSENVEIGYYVRSGTTVAELVYSRQVEVVLPVEEEYVSWLTPEMEMSSMKGSAVLIDIPGSGLSVYGYIDRIAPFVNEQTRMADVFVLIDDPFCMENRENCYPVAVGAFVVATIMAVPPEGTVSIPSSALQERGCVYVVGEDGLLVIRKVETLYMNGGTAWVKGEISPGDRVVVTPLPGVSDGMRVDIFQPESKGNLKGMTE